MINQNCKLTLEKAYEMLKRIKDLRDKTRNLYCAYINTKDGEYGVVIHILFMGNPLAIKGVSMSKEQWGIFSEAFQNIIKEYVENAKILIDEYCETCKFSIAMIIEIPNE